jgi:gluconate 5-dehydrogenase
MNNEKLKSAFDLNGQTALITGGGTGLGLGMAGCLVAAGAGVVLVGRRKAELRRWANMRSRLLAT